MTLPFCLNSRDSPDRSTCAAQVAFGVPSIKVEQQATEPQQFAGGEHFARFIRELARFARPPKTSGSCSQAPHSLVPRWSHCVERSSTCIVNSLRRLLSASPSRQPPRTRSIYSCFFDVCSVWRVLIHRNPHPTNPNILRTINSQKADRCIAYVGQPDQFRRVIAPAEMLLPVITLWMKQTRLPRGRDRCQYSI